jgi:hypothetical protein
LYLDGGYANPFEGLDDLVVGLYAVYGNTRFELTIDGSRTTSWNNLIQNHKPEQDKIRRLMMEQEKTTLAGAKS